MIRKAITALAAVIMLTTLAGVQPASAATCGGNIVASTQPYNGKYNVLWVDKRFSLSGRVSQITFYNGSWTESVPNSDWGVRYSPIADTGRYFIFGVAERWIYSSPWHGSWRDTFRWRIMYNC